MNTLSMKGNWKEVAGKLKQQFANLTDDDLLFKEGKEEELLGRLQQKLGKTKEELRKMIAKLWTGIGLNGNGSSVRKNGEPLRKLMNDELAAITGKMKSL
jgi:uncharacterized protein YjbJ (UPF0337 family)